MSSETPFESEPVRTFADATGIVWRIGKSTSCVTLAIAGLLDAAAKPVVAQSSDPVPVAAVPSAIRVPLRTVIEDFAFAFQRNADLESALSALEAHEPASTVEAYRKAAGSSFSGAGKKTTEWLKERAAKSKTARTALLAICSERDLDSALAQCILREAGSEAEEAMFEALKNIPSKPQGKFWVDEEHRARYAGFGAAKVLSQVLMGNTASAGTSASLAELVSAKETQDLPKRLSALTLVKGGQYKTVTDLVEKDKNLAPTFARAFMHALKSGEKFLPADPLEAEKKFNELGFALQKTIVALGYYNPDVVRDLWDGYREMSEVVRANANLARKEKAQSAKTLR